MKLSQNHIKESLTLLRAKFTHSLDFSTTRHSLCLPLKPSTGGGVFSFMRLFRDYLDSQDYNYVDNLGKRYKYLLTAAWTTSYECVKYALEINPDLKIIHRVDGSAYAYGRFDDSDERLAKVNTLAHTTIFQSEFSRWVTTIKYPLVKVEGPTIFNPVDTKLFSPTGSKVNLPSGVKICGAAWSTNCMKGLWQMPLLAENNPDIQFVVCGKHSPFPNLPNLQIMGPVTREKMAAVMRSCDLFLNLSLNDPCPNVVIEALSSGLPVLYINSGGTPELVGNAGIALTIDTFRDAFETVIDDLSHYKQLARQRALSTFDINIIGRQYLSVIENH